MLQEISVRLGSPDLRRTPMRKLARGMLICGLVLAIAPRAVAGEQEDALALVEQAIKAHGGADALTKAQTLVRTGVGSVSVPDKPQPFTDEWTWHLPDQLRFSIEVDKKFRIITVVNGDKGWQNTGGQTMELTGELLRERRDEMYVLWLATLTPLKKDDVKLSLLPEIKVNDEPAVGVQAKSKAAPDGINLYFDKKTHLLVKIQRRARQSGVAVDKEYVYSDHKEFDGVKLPTKLVELINGRKFSEITKATYKLQTKFDDATFAKP
jgi:hypothetical protein